MPTRHFIFYLAALAAIGCTSTAAPPPAPVDAHNRRANSVVDTGRLDPSITEAMLRGELGALHVDHPASTTRLRRHGAARVVRLEATTAAGVVMVEFEIAYADLVAGVEEEVAGDAIVTGRSGVSSRAWDFTDEGVAEYRLVPGDDPGTAQLTLTAWFGSVGQSIDAVAVIAP